jgi:hypothetical protein
MQPIIMPFPTKSTREGLDVILYVCKLGLGGLAGGCFAKAELYGGSWLSLWIINEHLG